MNLKKIDLGETFANKRTTVSLAVAGILVVTACAWGLGASSVAQASAPAASQAMPVEIAEVVSRKIVDWSNFSGRLEAIDRVEIRPQVSGVLTAVHFKDGALVKKGDLLFTIDQRPFAAEVFAAEARAEFTGAEFARAERLLAENAIAKRDFEEKKNAAHAAQAALRIARLNLEYAQIRAPIDGRISRAEITIGNLVTANGAAPLTTLVSSDKIYASFDVDEQTFLKHINPARAAKGNSLPVQLGLANESSFSREGVIHSIDNRLDTTAGTIRVRALFDNKDNQLVPGLYARLRLGGGQEREAVLIAEKAVGTDQAKRFVLVVDKDNNTAYREVKTGATQDGLIIVESGLQAGERIVVNGLQRVHPGAPVVPQIVDMKTGKAADSAATEKKAG